MKQDINNIPPALRKRYLDSKKDKKSLGKFFTKKEQTKNKGPISAKNKKNVIKSTQNRPKFKKKTAKAKLSVGEKNRIAIKISIGFLAVLGWVLFIYSSLPILATIVISLLFVLSIVIEKKYKRTGSSSVIKNDISSNITENVVPKMNDNAFEQSAELDPAQNSTSNDKKVEYKPLPKPTYATDIAISENTVEIPKENIDKAILAAINRVGTSEKLPKISAFTDKSISNNTSASSKKTKKRKTA